MRIVADPFGVVQDWTNNVLQGNTIGTDVTGTRDLGNAADGVSIMTSSHLAANDTVGGTDPGAGNVIAFNGGRGVSALFGTGNAVRGNDIFNNGGLDLITDINGVLSTYAENRSAGLSSNLPVLTSAVFDPQGTVLTGTLTGTPFVHMISISSPATHSARVDSARGRSTWNRSRS